MSNLWGGTRQRKKKGGGNTVSFWPPLFPLRSSLGDNDEGGAGRAGRRAVVPTAGRRCNKSKKECHNLATYLNGKEGLVIRSKRERANRRLTCGLPWGSRSERKKDHDASIFYGKKNEKPEKKGDGTRICPHLLDGRRHAVRGIPVLSFWEPH